MKRALLLAAALAASGPAAEIITLQGRAMGTAWTVKFESEEGDCDADTVRRQIAEKLEGLEQQLSTYRPGSALSRFNTAAHTEWFPVPPDLARVADESRRVAELTAGAFDPTVDPLVRLWGFGPEGRADAVPSARDITLARQRVGWPMLEVRLAPPALRRVRLGVTADFSSTAKGFAADAVSALLTSLRLPRHLVQVGGDVRAGAAAGEGAGWPIAIEQPLDERSGVACVVTLAGQAVSTSGDYRNFFRVGRRRYGHIIDPRTGLPAHGELASVTVVHTSAATSSSLATGLFVLGAEAGLRLAKREGLACLFLIREGHSLVRLATPEFEKLLP